MGSTSRTRTPRTSTWRGRAVPFAPMPMPVCRTSLSDKWVQYEVRRTSLGRGMGMNLAARRTLAGVDVDLGLAPPAAVLTDDAGAEGATLRILVRGARPTNSADRITMFFMFFRTAQKSNFQSALLVAGTWPGRVPTARAASRTSPAPSSGRAVSKREAQQIQTQ